MSSAANKDQEKELKIALGGAAEFARWRRLLGEPQRVLEQRNFYFETPRLGKSALLRIRAACPADCPYFSASPCPLAEQITACTGTDAAAALLASREQPSKHYIFTLKQGGQRSAQGYFQHLELESELNSRQIAGVFHGSLTELANTAPGRHLLAQGADSCRYLGALHNTRLCYPRPEGEVWELDLTHFAAGSECELEVETEQPERALEQIKAASIGAGWSFQTLTKIERFMQAQPR